MKVRKEYIILLLLILLSLVYLFVKKDFKIHYDVPQLDALEREEIEKMTIEDSTNSVELKKEGDSWIFLPEGYRADLTQINSLLGEVTNLSLMDLISKRNNYDRYELDEKKALTVSVYTQEGPVLEFLLGKSSSNNIYSYIRLKDRDGIYSVQGNLKPIFTPSVDKWRDKQVVSFDPQSIREIEVLRDDERKKFVLTGEGDQASWTEEETPLENSDEIKDRIKAVSILKTTAYLEEVSGKPLLEVRFKGDASHSITIFEKLEDGYSAQSSYSDYPFILPSYMADDILDLF